MDTPEQLRKFIETLNNQNNWYSELAIDENTTILSLMDARYGYYAKSYDEREILQHFENLLKRNTNRNYYEILLYHFISAMTNTTLFDDIEIFSIIPSSDTSFNEDMMNFMKQVRYIKGKRIPRNIEIENPLIRHTEKAKAHETMSEQQRLAMRSDIELNTLCVNDGFKNKIDKLVKENRLNVCIFDDYMTHGNTFNAPLIYLDH